MGAIAEAIVAYAQPLIDQTDGSEEQLNRAFAISQLCYNLALTQEDRRDEMLREVQSSLEMDDKDFDEFRRSIVVPMIRRHEEMFPRMHNRPSAGVWQSGLSAGFSSLPATRKKGTRGEPYPGTDRYAPCPCGSGRKYKFCCGKTGT